jgi:hypothetical protein
MEQSETDKDRSGEAASEEEPEEDDEEFFVLRKRLKFQARL